jgi:uncharacterized membrane protein
VYFLPLALAFPAWTPQFSFVGGAAPELIVLRFLHIVSGVIWIGLLYFFNLVLAPTMQKLEPSVRVKVHPVLMSRAMAWFRWSALMTVAMGMRYFLVVLSADAHNAGDRSLTLRWFGWWLLVWMLAFELIYALQRPRKGFLDNPWVRVSGIALVVIAASWIVLVLNGGNTVSNQHLAISIGGGLGFVMLLNTWFVVWRIQKRLIAATRASALQGIPLPPEAADLMRWSFLTARTGFWLSFPMLFFMAAASHYPFLSSVAR